MVSKLCNRGESGMTRFGLPEDREFPSIPVEEFEAHVANLQLDSDAGFQREFQVSLLLLLFLH